MPPLVGAAVKVTLVPEQMLVAEADTATEGTTVVLTVMVTGVEVAVVGDAHEAEDVITQVTTSPLANAALLYVALLEPTLPPLSFH